MTKQHDESLMRDVLPPHALCGLPQDTPVLLGFSGGADSSALLYILLSMRERYGFSLTLAHLDHGIRGEEAARDRTFCEQVAATLGLDIVCRRRDVPALAKESGTSIEEAARSARYAFFADVMEERRIPILVTAHHATDNLETLLFRLMRGTGSRGLCGIRPSRPFACGFVVRPLLAISAGQIRSYCKERGIAFVTDSTNCDTAYTRNRIRRELLPLMEEFGEVEAKSARLCRELGEDNDYLDSLALSFLKTHQTERGIPLEELQKAPPPILRRVLLTFAKEQGAPSLVHTQLSSLTSLALSARKTQEVRLGGGLVAYVEGGMLRTSVGDPAREADFCLPLSLGETLASGTGVRICVTRIDETIKIHNLSTVPHIILSGEFDIMKSGAYWRTRREGDLLLLRGMHRKLRRLQNEAGLSPRQRCTLPLLCDGAGVLWAPLIGHSDRLPVKTEKDACTGDLLICLVDETI